MINFFFGGGEECGIFDLDTLVRKCHLVWHFPLIETGPDVPNCRVDVLNIARPTPPVDVLILH